MKVLGGFPFDVLVTDGYDQQASVIAYRVERAAGWLSQILKFHPKFRLVVSSEADWADAAEFPVYGMPHTAAEALVVGTEAATFFSDVATSFWPHLTDATRSRMRACYGDPLDLGPFVDLIAVHELAHLYHEQVPFSFPTFWLNEFFANLAMVGYVADNEPALQEMVDVFAAAAMQTPASEMTVSRLAQMEASLGVGPGNYVWFQMVLIAHATELWHSADADGLRAIHECFRGDMNEDTILRELHLVDPTASRVVTEWPA